MLSTGVVQEGHGLDPGAFGLIRDGAGEQCGVQCPECAPQGLFHRAIPRPPAAALAPQVPSHCAQDEKGRDRGQDEAFLLVDESAVEDEEDDNRNDHPPPHGLGGTPVEGAPEDHQAPWGMSSPSRVRMYWYQGPLG